MATSFSRFSILAAGVSLLLARVLMTRAARKTESRRVTAQLSPNFVVFIIGVSLNNPWRTLLRALMGDSKSRNLFWSLSQMPVMIKELKAHPELGLLHVESVPQSIFSRLQGSPSVMVQYWKSKKHLMDFSRGKDNSHYPAWLAFNKSIRKDENAVGIYHETYEVANYESIARGIPPDFGILGAAKNHVKYFGGGGVSEIRKGNASMALRMGEDDPNMQSLEGFADYRPLL